MKNDEMTLSDEEATAIGQLFKASDELCTAVISGSAGQMQLALAVARAISDYRRIGHPERGTTKHHR